MWHCTAGGTQPIGAASGAASGATSERPGGDPAKPGGRGLLQQRGNGQVLLI
jgi:hypothetical protein